MARTILVFDSGIGGLSVLKEIQEILPNERYCYLFDNARLPYGNLAPDVLIAGCVELVTKVAKAIQADIVVIACNTASTLVLPALRAQLSQPVVGVVPAIKPAAEQSKTKHIGLLATPGTVKRDYTHDLIQKFAQNCQVSLLGSSELVLLAEQKIAGLAIEQAKICEILAPFQKVDIDVVVLGCTHFPMIKAEISQCLGEEILLLDSGKAVAKRVKSLLATAESAIKVDNDFTLSKQENFPAFYTAATVHPNLVTLLSEFGFVRVEHV